MDDPTIKRVTKFSRRWGFGGFVVVNLYPFRTPHPSALWEWVASEGRGPDFGVREALTMNFEIIGREARQASMILAAWGAGAKDPAHIDQALGGMDPDANLFCLRRSKDGHPVHPLARGVHRVPDEADPIAFWRQQAA